MTKTQKSFSFLLRVVLSLWLIKSSFPPSMALPKVRLVSFSQWKNLGSLGIGVLWMSVTGVESAPQVIGSVPPQTISAHDSLFIPLNLSTLFTDHFSVQIDRCSLTSCELQGGPHSILTVDTGTSYGVAVGQNWAYVVSHENGLSLVNINNPFRPSVVGVADTGISHGVVLVGTYVFVATWDRGLRIVDVSLPFSPSIVSTVPTGDSRGVAVKGDYAYVATLDSGLQIVNISDPLSPSLLSNVSTGNSRRVTVEGNYAYVTSGNGLRIVDVTNPFSPFVTHTVGTDYSSEVTVEGSYAFAATDGGLRIVNISDPLYSYITVNTGESYGVTVQGNYAYVTTTNSGLQILDISDPSSPSIIGTVPIGWSSQVVLKGKFAFIAAVNDGFHVLSDGNVLIASTDSTGRKEEIIALRECSEPLEIQVIVQRPSHLALIIVLPIVLVGIVLLALLVAFFFYRKRKFRSSFKEELFGEDLKSQFPSKDEELSSNRVPSGHSSLPSTWEIPFSQLTLKEEVGRGSYGVVYLGNWRQQKVAIKKILNGTNDPQKLDEFRKEVALMTKLRPHQNVVMLLGVCSTKELCIVTEFLAKGSVWDYLQKNSIDMEQTLQWAKHVASGMSHLHAEGVVHRDLACRNLLLTENLQIKVSDFGLARICDNAEGTNLTQSTVGPVRWMAPECLKQQKYSTKSDVWAWGITMIEILTRKVPYPELNPMTVCLEVVHEGLRHPIPSHTPPELAVLLEQVFQTDPKDRPEFAQIWEHLENRTIS